MKSLSIYFYCLIKYESELAHVGMIERSTQLANELTWYTINVCKWVGTTTLVNACGTL